MELKSGYKQTEVGVIPEEWKVVPLSRTARRITRGASPRPIDSPLWFDDESGVGWVRISDVTRSHRYLEETAQRLSDAGIRNSRFVRSGGLIMSICATVGRPIETRIDACIHDGFVVFEQPQINQSFLYHALVDLEQTWSRRGQTGSQMNLNTGLINGRLVAIPRTEAEQRAIATALSDVDALLDGLARLIAKKRDLKQAAMQQLLTGQTRLPGFGAKWVARPLGQVGDIKSGGTPSTTQAHFWDGGVPWCTPTDITGLRGRKYLIDTARTISTAGLQFSSAEVVPPRSLIMTSRATIGECAINLVPVTTNQGFKSIVTFAEIDVEFLYYLMTTQKTSLVALCAGSTFLEIGKKQLSGYMIKLPKDRVEQETIAAVLDDMDAELAALETRRDKTRDLKKAMMQELLTGRTRLI